LPKTLQQAAQTGNVVNENASRYPEASLGLGSDTTAACGGVIIAKTAVSDIGVPGLNQMCPAAIT
jgi:hypothetical protein